MMCHDMPPSRLSSDLISPVPCAEVSPLSMIHQPSPTRSATSVTHSRPSALGPHGGDGCRPSLISPSVHQPIISRAPSPFTSILTSVRPSLSCSSHFRVELMSVDSRHCTNGTLFWSSPLSPSVGVNSCPFSAPHSPLYLLSAPTPYPKYFE